ncbi:MAG: hypothetical protein PQJ50_02755, partial [Spirochaetales bacterium]|nr:hypothetical protein [Spirochaetales bacterium]
MRKKVIYTFSRFAVIIIVLISLLVASCATGAKGERLAPDWFQDLEESEDDSSWLIKITAFGNS